MIPGLSYHNETGETPPAPIRPRRFGALFYWVTLAVTGGATQLAVITTPSHTNFPSGQGRVKLCALTRTQRAGMTNPECRADIHPVKETRLTRTTTSSSPILLITATLRSVPPEINCGF